MLVVKNMARLVSEGVVEAPVQYNTQRVFLALVFQPLYWRVYSWRLASERGSSFMGGAIMRGRKRTWDCTVRNVVQVIVASKFVSSCICARSC